MHLDADMVSNQPHDALAIGGRQRLTRIGQPFGEAIYPETAVRVQHDFDDGRVFEKMGDGRAERGAKHARTARECFRLLADIGHSCPAS